MKKRKGSRGAISVFLAMILVPCIVVSSVFVDLSRVHLSKTMAESSADLALNALLTNYDADLKEWYGMVASCQNINEFYEVSANYFLRTISSQGLSDEEIILLSDYYSNATGDDTIYDLLKIECKTDTSALVSNVAKADLSNPALLKDQVVEFMKYRAPIVIAEDLYSLVQNADGSESAQATAIIENEENEDLVESKQEFFEAEGELLTAAFYSYWAIRDYYEAANKMGLTNDKLKSYEDKINGYKTGYAMIHNAVVKNLFNTSSLTAPYNRVNITLNNYINTYTESDICSRKETVDGETTYYIDGKEITDLLDNLAKEIGLFDQAKDAYASAAASLMSKLPGDGDSQSYGVQWWLQMNQKVNYGSGSPHDNVKKAAKNMLIAYAKVIAIDSCTLGNDIPSDWETRFIDLTSQVASRQGKYLTRNITDNNDGYLKAVKKLEDVSRQYEDTVESDGSGVTVSINGSSYTVKQAISHISTDLTNLRKDLQARIDELDIAIEGDGDKVKSLAKLKTLAAEYKTSFKDWSDTADTTYSADGGYTSLAEKDQDEIAEMTLEAKIDSASVTELETRLKNIRSQLQALVDAIDSMKYGNKKVTEIKSLDTFKGETDNQVSSNSIKLMNNELNKYAGDTFGKLFKPTSSKVVTLSNLTGNSHNPHLDPDKDAANTPALLVHFHEQYGPTPRDKVNKAKEEEKKMKEDQKKYEEEQQDKLVEGREYGGSIERTYSAENTSYNAGLGMIKTVAGLFKDLLKGNLDGIRDDIYVTTYITNMFSYATFDFEAKYDMLSDEDKKALTPDSAKEKYDTLDGAADKPGTWLSTDVKDVYNKSLTNKMINSENNQAYLSEVEYILYGGTDNKANVKKAFGEIYAFRFALNTVSAFQHFWGSGNETGAAINAISGAISGAFGGILPPPVIKAVILPILAAVETCNDNARLAKGMPVELYKIDADDWWISLTLDMRNPAGYGEFFTNLKGAIGTGKNQDEGIYYSDYLTIFVYSGLSGGGKVEENMYKRMAEVIQANMQKMIGGEPKYLLSNSRVYFKLDATIQVKPLMIAMPIFNEYENEMDTKTGWCTYEIHTVRGYN